MPRIFNRSWIAMALTGWMVSSTIVLGADRSAEDILKALDRIKMPSVDRSRVKDRYYVEQFQRAYMEAADQRDRLILELKRTDLENVQLPPLMAEHWSRMMPFGPDASKREREIREVLEQSKNPRLKLEALFAKAQGGVFKARETGAVDLTGLDEFIKLHERSARRKPPLYVNVPFQG